MKKHIKYFISSSHNNKIEEPNLFIAITIRCFTESSLVYTYMFYILYYLKYCLIIKNIICYFFVFGLFYHIYSMNYYEF